MADPTPVLITGPVDADIRFILAHGAGAPMDSVLLEGFTTRLVDAGCCVVRFEFPYMAGRRTGGGRRPPDPQAVLLETWRGVAAAHRGPGCTVLGGHSMGGRMASMVADDVGADALCCVAYPWHPPGKPGQTRTAHLGALRTRTLMVCGMTDEFGTPEEVARYALSPAIRVHWMPATDHSLRSRRGTGRTLKGNLQEAADTMVRFAREGSAVTPPPG